MKTKTKVRPVHHQLMSAMANLCPPHEFEAAFMGDEKPARLYCKQCGEVRKLRVARTAAPAMESDR